MISAPGLTLISPLSLRRLKLGVGLLVVPLALYLLLVYFWPVVGLLSTSVTEPEAGLHHYQRLIDRPIYLQVMMRTLWLAVVVTFATVVIGYPVSYYLSVASPLQARLLFFLIFLPFWSSIMVRTYGLMVILGREGVLNAALLRLGMVDQPIQFMFNTSIVRVAMVQILLPFFVLPLYTVMRGIDPNLLDAARGLGGRPWQVFRHVYWPLSVPGVFAGGLIVFVFSLGFFITPALLGGRSDITIAMLILDQFEATLDWGFGATLSTVLFAATLLAIFLVTRITGADRLAAAR